MKRAILDDRSESKFRVHIEGRERRLNAVARDAGDRDREARLGLRASEGELETLLTRYRGQPQRIIDRERKRLEAIVESNRQLAERLHRESQEAQREWADAHRLLQRCIAYLRERGVALELAPAANEEAPFGAKAILGGAR